MKTMTYETFLPEIRMAVQAASPDDVSVSVKTIKKNNNVDLDALVITKEGYTTAPTLYIKPYFDDYTENGTPIDVITNRIISQYQDAAISAPFDISDFMDFDKVKDHIVMRLINRDLNKEMLKEVPHVEYLDLAITFCILLESADHCNATILLRNEHLDLWKKDPDEIYAYAKENTPKLLPWKFNSMADVLGRMIEDIDEDTSDQISLNILTNKDNMFGAACILYDGLLQDLSRKIGDFYLIPSSIHECLLFPVSTFNSTEEINDIIRQVNTNTVDEQEILSDHAYIFTASTGKLTIPEAVNA